MDISTKNKKSLILLKILFVTFRERGREKEERNIDWLPLQLTWDLVCNPGMCPDWVLNWQPFGSQASAQSTEPHQLGQKV